MIKKLVDRMNIKQRFLGSVCLFSLPLGVLFYFNIDQLSDKIQFARGEQAGNRVQGPAVLLVEALGEYQAALAGGKTEEISSRKEKVEGLVNQLEAANNEVGANISLTDERLKRDGLDGSSPHSISNRWQAFSGLGTVNKQQSDAYEQLAQDVRGFISHAGDASNLTLDPEMDSYYLADITSVAITQTVNRIKSAEIALAPFLKTGRLPGATQTAMTIFAATLKESDFDRITGDLETAVKENAKSPRGASPTLKNAVEPALARYKADTEALIKAASSLADGKAIPEYEFRQTAARATDSALELSKAAVSELNTVLQMRIDGFAKYRWKLVLGTAIALAFALVVLLFTVRAVTRPLSETVAHVDSVASGDLSRQIPPEYLNRQDEIGKLARAVQEMSTRLRSILGDISAGVDTIAHASSSLRSESTHMSVEAKSACEKAQLVAAAAEEMSSNVTSVAAGMEQTTTNLGNVVHGTEQMTTTIAEIARNSEEARNITQRATTQADQVNQQISHLSESVHEIGKVTETITAISSQINLLALNATIEASRAGAAGKGFAVVASEIKELAQQTATATDDIGERITSVQNSTASGVKEIQKISHVIHGLNEIVNSIAAAIEEQAASTKHIAQNIDEASKGVDHSNARVAESSSVSREIAKDISVVHRAATDIEQGAAGVNSSSEELARVAESLKSVVKQFTI